MINEFMLHKHQRTKRDNKYIIQKYKEYGSISKTSEVTGWSYSTCIRVLEEAGLYKAKKMPRKNINPDIEWDDTEEKLEGLTYADREPKIYDVVINGKKFKDVTELYGF